MTRAAVMIRLPDVPRRGNPLQKNAFKVNLCVTLASFIAITLLTIPKIDNNMSPPCEPHALNARHPPPCTLRSSLCRDNDLGSRIELEEGVHGLAAAHNRCGKEGGQVFLELNDARADDGGVDAAVERRRRGKGREGNPRQVLDKLSVQLYKAAPATRDGERHRAAVRTPQLNLDEQCVGHEWGSHCPLTPHLGCPRHCGNHRPGVHHIPHALRGRRPAGPPPDPGLDDGRRRFDVGSRSWENSSDEASKQPSWGCLYGGGKGFPQPVTRDRGCTLLALMLRVVLLGQLPRA
mmetsp:Transcript_24685/g.59259  ORF Transcript_24685/g.59259 Transcript_24685/m.59259 type:complete len:292 (-) Transcript_24685:379-1254(-)